MLNICCSRIVTQIKLWCFSDNCYYPMLLGIYYAIFLFFPLLQFSVAVLYLQNVIESVMVPLRNSLFLSFIARGKSVVL